MIEILTKLYSADYADYDDDDDEKWRSKWCPPISSLSHLAPLYISSLAPLTRRLLHTAVELNTAAQCRGVNTFPPLLLAPLLGSAPLLSSRSAASQTWNTQARNSGVAWGGVWEGRLTHLFPVSTTNCTCGVDVLLSDLICSPLKLVIVFNCQTVELDPTGQPAPVSWWFDPLQELVVLDYELIIDRRTAADV